MKRTIVTGLVAVILSGGALWTTTARAQNLPPPNTGNELIQYCGEAISVMDGEQKSHMDFHAAGVCQGLLKGVWDVSRNSDTPLYRRVCPRDPNTITLEQVTRVVHKWLEDHPERLHEPSSWLATEALARSWSCLEDTITGQRDVGGARSR